MNRSLIDRLARLEQSVGIQMLPADRQAAVEELELTFKAAAVAHAALRVVGAASRGARTVPPPAIFAFPEEADRLLVELRGLTLEVGRAWEHRRERLLSEIASPSTLKLDGPDRDCMRRSLVATIAALRAGDEER